MRSAIQITAVLLLAAMTFLASCQEEEIDPKEQVRADLLGAWHSYSYQFDSETTVNESRPYIILLEYGSGFVLEGNKYYTHYDSVPPIGKTLRGTWELLDETTIEFHPDTSVLLRPSFLVDILDLKQNSLQTHENDVTYNLRRIAE